MKKTLALILALLMVVPMLVFPTAAEETTTAVAEESTLKIVPLSDCDSKANWSSTMALVEDKSIYSQGTGSIGFSFSGIAYGTGNVSWMWQNAAAPIDITGMTALRFDIYLQNAQGIAAAFFDMEIRDVDHLVAVDTDGDGKVDSEIEATGGIHIAKYIKGEVKDGWNTIEIPFSALRGWDMVDLSRVAYFRMFQSNPGKSVNATTGQVTYGGPQNLIGTEGVDTVIRLDNFYFESELTAEQEDTSTRITHNYAFNYFTGATREFIIQKMPVTDARNYDTLVFDVFMDDLSLAKATLNIELTSGGACDVEETRWADSIQVLANKIGLELKVGWNRFEVPIHLLSYTRFGYATNGSVNGGPCDLSNLDFFRIFLTQGTFTVDDDGDGKTGVELDAETGLPENEFAHCVGFSCPTLVTRNTDMVVDLWDAQSVPAGISASGGVSDFDGDGVKEWVLVNETGEKTHAGADFVKTLTFDTNTRPGYGNMVGIEFDIYVSDTRAVTSGAFETEFSHTGACDGYGEVKHYGTLQNIVGETIVAGEWQTVRIMIDSIIPKRDLTKLETYAASADSKNYYGEFQPYGFNYIRWHFGYGFTTKDLVLAVRNFKVIRDFGEPEVEVADNCTAPIRMDLIDGETVGHRKKIPTENDQLNMAMRIADVRAGQTFEFGMQTAMKLATPLNVSDYDLLHFDLYLENYLPNVPVEFEMTSGGKEDTNESNFSNKTLATITGRTDLKDGWNHIAIPIRNFEGSCNWSAFNFMRIFTQNSSDIVVTKDTVIAIDNVYFEKLESGEGYVDQCIKGGSATGTMIEKDGNATNTVWVAASGDGTSVQKAGTRSMRVSYTWKNLTKESILSMDIYIQNYDAIKNTSWQFEINGSRAVDDAHESQLSGSIKQMFNAYVINPDGSKGEISEGWNHVEVPLSAFGGLKDFSVINYLGTYNSQQIEATGNPYMVAYDNITFLNPAPKAEPVSKIYSAAPTLTETINFTIKAQDDLKRPVTMECVFTGEAGTTKTITPMNVEGDYYVSAFDDIPAHRMGDTLTMTMWTLENGKLLKVETKDYSAQQYAANMLANNASNEKLVTLLSDMLVYGAAAQVYANYNVENLASAVEGLKPTEGFNVPGTIVDVILGSPAENGPKFRSVTLVLDGTVHIRYTFSAASVEGLTLTVGDKTYSKFESLDGYYYVDVPVAANQFDTVYNAHFGEDTAYSVNYSVNHYIATMYNPAQLKTAALLEALYNYGASAAAYQ